MKDQLLIKTILKAGLFTFIFACGESHLRAEVVQYQIGNKLEKITMQSPANIEKTGHTYWYGEMVSNTDTKTLNLNNIILSMSDKYTAQGFGTSRSSISFDLRDCSLPLGNGKDVQGQCVANVNSSLLSNSLRLKTTIKATLTPDKGTLVYSFTIPAIHRYRYPTKYTVKISGPVGAPVIIQPVATSTPTSR